MGSGLVFAVIPLPPGVTKVVDYCSTKFSHMSYLATIDTSRNDFRINLARDKAIIPATADQMEGEDYVVLLNSYEEFLGYLRDNDPEWIEAEEDTKYV